MANLYCRGKGEMIGVDIDSLSIKALKLSKSGQSIQLLELVDIPLESGIIADNTFDRSAIVSMLQVAMKSINAKSKTDAAFSFPVDEAYHKTESFAADTTAAELEQIIRNGTNKYTLLQGGVNFDFSILENEDGGSKQVEIITIQTDIVSEWSKIMVESGLTPRVASINSSAVQNALSISTKYDSSDQPVALLDMGVQSSTFYVSKNNKVTYKENCDFGIQSLIDAVASKYECSNLNALELIKNGGRSKDDYCDQVLKPFLAELYDHIESAIRFSDYDEVNKYKMILLSGEVADIKDVVKYLRDPLKNKVSLFNPLDDVLLPTSADKSKYDLIGPKFVKAFGLALFQYRHGVNLLPWREELSVALKKKYRATALLSVMIGFVISAGVWSYFSNIEDSLKSGNNLVLEKNKEMDEKLESLKDISVRREDMIKRMELIQGLESKRPTTVSVINSIVQDMPHDAYLTNLSKDKDSFIFEGKAVNSAVVAEFMRKLKSTGWFKNISMSSYIAYSENNMNSETKQSYERRAEGKFGSFVVSADILEKQFDKGDVAGDDDKTTTTDANASMDESMEKADAKPQESNEPAIALPPEVVGASQSQINKGGNQVEKVVGQLEPKISGANHE